MLRLDSSTYQIYAQNTSGALVSTVNHITSCLQHDLAQHITKYDIEYFTVEWYVVYI